MNKGERKKIVLEECSQVGGASHANQPESTSFSGARASGTGVAEATLTSPLGAPSASNVAQVCFTP